VKAIAMVPVLVAFLSTLAQAQQSIGPDPEESSGASLEPGAGILSLASRTPETFGAWEVRETDAAHGALPKSLSEELGNLEKYESEFSIGPAVGFLTAHGADRGTWFAGAQARLHFLRFLAVDASMTVHVNEYEHGDITVTQYPVQVTGLLYPFPEGQVRPYALGGVGWYYTRTHYRGPFSLLYKDQTTNTVGAHLGAGVEARVGPSASLNADVRYIFLNPDVDGVKSRDFDYWQFTAGLNLFF